MLAIAILLGSISLLGPKDPASWLRHHHDWFAYSMSSKLRANQTRTTESQVKLDKSDYDPQDFQPPVKLKPDWELELEQSHSTHHDVGLTPLLRAQRILLEQALAQLVAARNVRALTAEEEQERQQYSGRVDTILLKEERISRAAGVVGGQLHPKYSSHECVGNTFEVEDSANPSAFETGPFKYRSCHYKDVCYSPYKDEFVFFARPEHFAKLYQMGEQGE
jgi:hypothetical protein